MRPGPPAPDSLCVGASRAVLVTGDGEILALDRAGAAKRLRGGPALLLCHARAVARRAGVKPPRACLDLLELFAFARPARFCLPTPAGLAQAVGLAPPDGLEDQALALPRIAAALIEEAAQAADAAQAQAMAHAMGQGPEGWPWSPMLLDGYRRAGGEPAKIRPSSALRVWNRLPEWQADAPPPPPSQHPIAPEEASDRLVRLRGSGAEDRPGQAAYAQALCASFAPRAREEAPRVVLAEAGTGTGKTLGYLAPASLWAERNGGSVWISTYTRNLQHQIDQEIERLHPDPVTRRRRVAMRKGRENYLCLLNFQEEVVRAETLIGGPVSVGLMARWIAASQNGDLTGGDLPGWLVDLLGPARTTALSDHRGECIHSACDHYGRCFIERSIRRARRADLVIANHALVMVQAALGGLDDGALPTRYVFDEGHHVFDAADGAFSGHLSGFETAELRRWLLGSEATGRAGRARGLRKRIGDLIQEPEDGRWLDDLDTASRALPGEGWLGRITDGVARGPTEHFLARVRDQVLARSDRPDSPYDLEVEPRPILDGLAEAAAAVDQALARIQEPLGRLADLMRDRLEDQSDQLDTAQRQRLEAACRQLERRAKGDLAGWRAMLACLTDGPQDAFVDWFAIRREDGRDLDIGYRRHWVDPTKPFAEALLKQAHGVAITSATLRDGTGDEAINWAAAEARTGAAHLAAPAVRAQVPSPFDYPAQTRVLVVTDVRKDDLGQVAGAYRALFQASRGGALGLFTAISRLRAVHGRIAAPLEQAGLTLMAQHVDGMDVSTLIDIFRGEVDSCLLGTDAVRDGVDVPGRSLRLIVFDRVPWPRPSLLHRARAEYWGKRRYTDMLVRLKLAQAFGRLVRRRDDRGVFVILDPMLPSRLTGAFPDGVTIERVGLKQAVDVTDGFVG